MSRRLNHVISVKQFLDTAFLDKLFRLAKKMEQDDRRGSLAKPLKGKILASVFYEPSTRTRFSFEAAMQKLGGSVISTESASHFSSAVKGESLEDTIRVVSGYADCIVLRHYQKGAAEIAAKVSSVPVINAGDGAGEHPTQALLDIYTIKKELGKIDNLAIALLGDLRNSRTIHSLMILLAEYHKIKLYCVSPSQVKLPAFYKNYAKDKGVKIEEVSDMKDCIQDIHVLYVTRIQKERFASTREYERVRSAYKIDTNLMKLLRKDAIIMDPLPRVEKISPDVDEDKRAAYFRQAKNGLYIRMALLSLIL